MKYLRFCCLIIITACCLCMTAVQCNNYTLNYTASKAHFKQLQFEKDKAVSAYIDEMQKYINKVSPSSALSALEIFDNCTHYSVDPIFVLAQGEIESHFGTEGRASRTHSVWNVGAYDNGQTKAQYKNVNESIKPYLKLLKKDYLVNKSEEDMMENFVNKNNLRYASAEDYESKLKHKYLYIVKHTKLDSLGQRINYYNQFI